MKPPRIFRKKKDPRGRKPMPVEDRTRHKKISVYEHTYEDIKRRAKKNELPVTKYMEKTFEDETVY